MEIERKYLIKMPNIEYIEETYKTNKSDIVQIYLTSPLGTERRIRQRISYGGYNYYTDKSDVEFGTHKEEKRLISGGYTYYTEKSDVEFGTRKEEERIISVDEYLKLMLEADTNKKPIKKTRYCIVYKGKCFELDIYPFWTDQAILEIELDNINETIEIPPEIEIIRDVTGDKSFSNCRLAEK